MKYIKSFLENSDSGEDRIQEFFLDLEDSFPVSVSVLKQKNSYLVQINSENQSIDRKIFSEIFKLSERLENMTEYCVGGMIVGNKRSLPFENETVIGNGRGVWTSVANADFFKRYDSSTTVYSTRDTQMFSRDDESGKMSFDALKLKINDQNDDILKRLLFIEIYIRKPNGMWDNDINW